MKNYAALVLTIAILVGLGFGFSSCKEDEPPVPPKLSFAESSMSVSEGAGTIAVELVLDKPYSKNLNIEYDLGGTAKDQSAVGTAEADYEVDGTHGLVVIQSGETSGFIEIDIYNDIAFEEDETIEISISDINTSDVELTADDEVLITITNDDQALQLSFVNQTVTVNEADQALEVQLTLDKPAPQDITVQYELSGSATDSVKASIEELNPDYYINREGVSYANGKTTAQLVIPAGQSTGVIDIRLYSDLLVEDGNPDTDPFDPETIVITVTPSSGISMADNTMEIQLEQEDGFLIALFWPDPVEDPAGDLHADMDLLIRVGDNTTTWLGVLTGSIMEGFEGPEIIFIPNAIDYPAYGLSYTYYEGTLDPLNFEVVYIDLVDGALEAAANTLSYEATYTAANINAWTNVSSTKVVQTFEKNESGFTTPTEIVVPDQGSRVGSRDNFTSTLKRNETRVSGSIQRLVERYKPR